MFFPTLLFGSCVVYESIVWGIREITPKQKIYIGPLAIGSVDVTQKAKILFSKFTERLKLFISPHTV